MPLDFQLRSTDGRARRGTITLPRGTIQTPVFMPVGTAATVKAMMPRDVREVGTQISLANTYHLHIQPGEALVEKAGGLHRFMAMDWPLLTDSGGFQVFSLPRREITEEGVTFEFKKGADPIFASPEWSMGVQKALGADIAMAFDECAPWPCSPAHARNAMDRTLRWLDRCIEAFGDDSPQALFGIVQGSVYEELRRVSAEETARRDLPGIAVGGVSVGEGHTLMMKAVDDAEPWLPTHKPRYLMGVGLPEDIVGAVGRGMDMFDCVIPTRYGRSGTCFTSRGRIRLTDRNMRADFYPIDAGCDCYACANFTRAYLHHLLASDELLGTMMCSLHNVRFYHRMMEQIRAAIEQGRYAAFAAEFERQYVAGDRARRREEFTPGLYASFAVGWARDRAHDEDLLEAERITSARSPSTRDDARVMAVEAESYETGPAPAGREGRPKGAGRPSSGHRPERRAPKTDTRGPKTDTRGPRAAAPDRNTSPAPRRADPRPPGPDPASGPRDKRAGGKRVKNRR